MLFYQRKEFSLVLLWIKLYAILVFVILVYLIFNYDVTAKKSIEIFVFNSFSSDKIIMH